MNSIMQEDIKHIIDSKAVDFQRFSGKTFLVTGATGMIGQNLVYTLLEANEELEQPIRIVALVRDANKAESIFGKSEWIHFVVGDVTSPFPFDARIDYIVHAASQTASKAFVEDPVGVITTAYQGTLNILNIAKEANTSGMVYLSTMEVYGAPESEEKITEDHGTNLNTMKVRSSYAESKRMCECLCAAYAEKYGVPVKVMRLAQTFGPGVRYNDGRVFAEFARCAIEGKDIILHTAGETKRSYLYTADAVTAILAVLMDGKVGEAYNAANEDTYCSIRELARLFTEVFDDRAIRVKIQLEDIEKMGYAPKLSMNLDTSKLKTLGWKALTPLPIMIKRLCKSMSEK